MKPTNMQDAFTRIYAREAWGKGKGSGTGSSPKYCAAYLEYLRELIASADTRSVLDLGCGDWQLYAGFKWPKGVHYTGVDVVQANVDRNDVLHPGTFVHADFAQPEVMRTLWKLYASELVLVKDVLQHWSTDDVARWLHVMKELPGWSTIVAVNNWQHWRSPAKNKLPRNINNQYRWAPIDMRKYGFTDVLYYPKGKFKQVAVLNNIGDIL